MKTAGNLLKTTIAKMLLITAGVMLTLALGTSATGAEQPAPMAITEDMSCGVCGMYPAKFVKWQTQVIFRDGVMVPFDGSKDMFKFILDMEKYEPKHTSADIAAIWVKDFATGAWLDGRKATYVVASTVMGPMGKELIPFGNDEAAGKFQVENKGMIKHFAEITLQDIKPLGMGMGGMMKKGMM